MNKPKVENLMTMSLSKTALFEQEAPSGLLVRNQTLAAVNDALYAAPAVHSAGTFHRRRNKSTYFYHFAHPTRNGLYPQVHYTSSLLGRGFAVEGIYWKRSMDFCCRLIWLHPPSFVCWLTFYAERRKNKR
jgi:hypothetical protein